MARNKMPRFWGAKAARAKEAKAIRTVEQRQQKLNDLRKATGEVVIMCMIAAAHDGFGLGEERLERAIQTAVQRSIQFDIEKRPRMENGKPVNGMAIAEKNLDKDVAGYFPADFVLPVCHMKRGQSLSDVNEMRQAAAKVAKFYAYGFHAEYGFGPGRTKRLMEMAMEYYAHFRDRAMSGDYYGYEELARKMSEIMHTEFDVIVEKKDRPVFAESMD